MRDIFPGEYIFPVEPCLSLFSLSPSSTLLRFSLPFAHSPPLSVSLFDVSATSARGSAMIIYKA